jgi:hypothetical protein
LLCLLIYIYIYIYIYINFAGCFILLLWCDYEFVFLFSWRNTYELCEVVWRFLSSCILFIGNIGYYNYFADQLCSKHSCGRSEGGWGVWSKTCWACYVDYVGSSCVGGGRRSVWGGYGVCFIYFYCGWCVFVIKSNIGFYVLAKVSFACCFSLLRLHMWKRSNSLSSPPCMIWYVFIRLIR